MEVAATLAVILCFIVFAVVVILHIKRSQQYPYERRLRPRPLDSEIDVSWLVPTQYRGTNHNSFRSGEWGLILETRSIAMQSGRRVCWRIGYADGMIDWVAVCDVGNYETK